MLIKSPRMLAAGPRERVAPMVLEYQSPTAALIARPVPLQSRHPGWVIVAAVAATLAVLTLVPIDQMVTAPGKVTATTGNLVVQPLGTPAVIGVPDVSLVRSINVKEGQLVHAGDVLAELDPTFTKADLGSLQAQVASLQAEVDRLTAETQDRPYVSDGSPAGQLQALLYAQRHAEFSAKMEAYAQQIGSARVKLAQATSDVAAYTERLKVAGVVEAKRRELEQFKVGSQLNRLQATDTRLTIDEQLATAKSLMVSTRRDLDALSAQRDSDAKQYAGQTSEQLTEQGRKLSDAREELNKALLRHKLVQLRAERDAIVLRVAQVSVGTVMQSGQEFIQLVPLDAPLQIEATVGGKDVGLVRVGDPVTIKFETFKFNLYGTAAGTVRTVNPDSFKDPDAQPPSNGSARPEDEIGQLLFRTRISIDEVQLHDLPEGAQIVPGMPVEADIRVARRTVMQFLMTVLIPAASEGMREP
jgi:HlyD family secretion protein